MATAAFEKPDAATERAKDEKVKSEPPCVELKIKPDCEVCGGIGLACCLKPIGPLRRCCNQLVYCACAQAIYHEKGPANEH